MDLQQKMLPRSRLRIKAPQLISLKPAVVEVDFCINAHAFAGAMNVVVCFRLYMIPAEVLVI